MKKNSIWLLCASALLALSPLASIAGDAACSAPGVTVITDPAGDELGDPAASFADILSVSIAETADNKLVFTYKVSDLSTLAPDQLWIVRFMTDVPPSDGTDEYWVGMLTGPDATPHFVYGTDGRVDGSGGSGPGLFTPAGDLDPASNFTPDGTITLVLDRSKVGGLGNGQTMFGIIVLTHRITPTDGTQPFMYGFRSVSTTNLDTDDTNLPDDFTLADCGGGKSGLLGLGALPLPLLTVLFGFAALRRARAAR